MVAKKKAEPKRVVNKAAAKKKPPPKSSGGHKPIPTGGGSPPPKKTSEKAKFIWAEGQQESGGRYNAQNGSSGALGRWQVMPANLPGWARQCGLEPISPQAFLNNPAYQDKMINCILGGYYDKYGPRGAAAAWYSGSPNPNATFGNPPVYVYVNDVMALMGKAPANTTVPGGAPLPPGFSATPPPGADDWSGHIKRSSAQFGNGATALETHTRRLQVIRR
jgi:hypothetical protein